MASSNITFNMAQSKNVKEKCTKEYIVRGFRNLINEKPSLSDEAKLLTDKNIIKISDDLIEAELKIESLLSSLPIPSFLKKTKTKYYDDGAYELSPGVLMKDFFSDMTGKNEITHITATICDQKISHNKSIVKYSFDFQLRSHCSNLEKYI